MSEEDEDHEKYQRKSLLERNKFFATTSLEGFGLIQTSKNRCEITFWYCIIFAFSIITLYHISTLTKDYLSHSTVTSVTIQKLPLFYNLGRYELRIQFGLPELNPAYVNSNKQVAFANPYDEQTPLSDHIDKELARLNTKKKMLNERWNYVLLPLLSNYAKFMSTCEIHNDICADDKQRTAKFEAIATDKMTEVRIEMQKVMQRSRSLGIPDKQMMRKLGLELLRWLNFHLRDPHGESYLATVANKDSKTWIIRLMNIQESELVPESFTAVYELNRREEVQVSDETRTQILFQAHVGKLTALLHLTKVLGKNSTYEDARQWYKKSYQPELTLLIGIKARLGTEGQTRMTAYMDQTTEWDTRATFQYKAIKNCDTDPKQATDDCMFREIIKKCKCQPLFIKSTMSSDTKYCDADDYLACFTDIHEENIRHSCSKATQLKCHQTFYETRSNGPSLKGSNNTMTVILDLLNNEHPFFEDDLAQNLGSYLAELGGAFDFWLGASVIALVHLVLYIYKQMVYAFRWASRYRVRRNSQKAVTDFQSKLSLQHFVSNLTSTAFNNNSSPLQSLTSEGTEVKLLADRLERLERNSTTQLNAALKWMGEISDRLEAIENRNR